MEKPKLSTAEILAQARRQGPTKAPEKIEPPQEDSIPLSPLFQAARDGNLQTLISELAAGATLNQVDHNGKSALHFALRHSHIAHYLVDIGADVRCLEADMPPLLGAIQQNDCLLVEKMLARGADIQRQSRDYGWSALMMAETEEMIALLVSHGASFDARNKAGFDAIEDRRFQAAAIRRREEERVQFYAKVGEASSYDPVLREKLLSGLSELSQESRAKEYDKRAEILERYREAERRRVQSFNNE